jgi:hypothetical protein
MIVHDFPTLVAEPDPSWNDQLKQYTPVLEKPGPTSQEPDGDSSYAKEKMKKKDKGDKVKPSKNISKSKVCSSSEIRDSPTWSRQKLFTVRDRCKSGVKRRCSKIS